MAKAIQGHCTTEVCLVTVGVQPYCCLTVLQRHPQRLCNPSLAAYNLRDKSFPALALKQLQAMAKKTQHSRQLCHLQRHQLPGWQILVHAICTVISEISILSSSYNRPPLPSCKPRGTAPMCGVQAVPTADPHPAPEAPTRHRPPTCGREEPVRGLHKPVHCLAQQPKQPYNATRLLHDHCQSMRGCQQPLPPLHFQEAM